MGSRTCALGLMFLFSFAQKQCCATAAMLESLSTAGIQAQQPSPEQWEAKMSAQANAYYHAALAHLYEEHMAMYGDSADASNAIEEYRLAIQSDPSSPFLPVALAELYAKAGRIRDAVLQAQAAITRDPGNLDALRLLGRIYLRTLGDAKTGEPGEILKLAIEQYETLIRMEPRNADDHVILGHLYVRRKDLAKSESEFKTALRLAPGSEDAISALAYLYDDEGTPDKAAQLLNSVPAQSRTVKIYLALGYTDQQQRDYKDAILAYQQVLRLDPDNLDALRGLAMNLEKDNQLEAALEKYATLQRADPKDPFPAQRILEIRRRLGRTDR